MDPTLQPQAQLPCVWLRGENMSSRGTENQKFAQAACSVPGVHVPAFPVGRDSLLMTKVTQKKTL